jgi:hypothetical protein
LVPGQAAEAATGSSIRPASASTTILKIAEFLKARLPRSAAYYRVILTAGNPKPKIFRGPVPQDGTSEKIPHRQAQKLH